jgi:hypothetical protein
VNGDGMGDLIFLGGQADSVTVYLGNGNGTFRSPLTTQVPHLFGYGNQQMAIGDFNGDGRADVAFEGRLEGDQGRTCNDSYFVLLSNLDGTFNVGLPVSLESCSNAESVATADFNGDGKSDIAVLTDNAVTILLSNDGATFIQAATIDSGAESDPDWLALAIADFNVDGVPDLAIVNSDALTTTVDLVQRTMEASAVLANVSVAY